MAAMRTSELREACAQARDFLVNLLCGEDPGFQVAREVADRLGKAVDSTDTNMVTVKCNFCPEEAEVRIDQPVDTIAPPDEWAAKSVIMSDGSTYAFFVCDKCIGGE